MYKIGLVSLVLVLLGSGLTGCQLMPNSERKMHPHLPPQQMAVLQSAVPQGFVSLHCTGDTSCEFGKLDNVVVINELNKQPTADAINAALVRLEPLQVADQPQASRYFVAMQSGKHEVKMRFYPITPERAENFSLIHHFELGKTYQMSMFRQRSNNVSSSLLSMAAPDPLCIHLLEDKKVIRKFCRPFDPKTGLGEFIEQRVTKS